MGVAAEAVAEPQRGSDDKSMGFYGALFLNQSDIA
jgi:hypothetical protein